MTQQRHIEAAKELIKEWEAPFSFLSWPNLEAAVARALAEAENRAAWDIHDVFFDVPDMRTYTAEKYGPRLEVKHE